MRETIVVLIDGFSSRRGRLKVLEDEIKGKRELPEMRIVVPEYFEKNSYGKTRRYLFRKKTISEYADVVYKQVLREIPDIYVDSVIWGFFETQLNKEYEEKPKIILIGYNMGGLICRCLVEKMKLLVTAVILVGTPNRGANFYWREKLLLKMMGNSCLQEMRKPSKFLHDILEIRPENYYYIAGISDKRVPLNSSIPEIGDYVKEGGWYGRVCAIPCDHSHLMPKIERDIQTSAIPAILEILEKEIST